MANKNTFSYIAGNDKIIIYWYSKVVKTLKGKDIDKFLMNITDMSDSQAQLYMAKLTGNFKRGDKNTR